MRQVGWRRWWKLLGILYVPKPLHCIVRLFLIPYSSQLLQLQTHLLNKQGGYNKIEMGGETGIVLPETRNKSRTWIFNLVIYIILFGIFCLTMIAFGWWVQTRNESNYAYTAWFFVHLSLNLRLMFYLVLLVKIASGMDKKLWMAYFTSH